MGSKGIKIIQQNCDANAAEDRSLPYTCYLVEYKKDGVSCYDLVTAGKQVDIFDEYWDKYRHDFVTMTQSEGRANPKLWGNTVKTKDKK